MSHFSYIVEKSCIYLCVCVCVAQDDQSFSTKPVSINLRCQRMYTREFFENFNFWERQRRRKMMAGSILNCNHYRAIEKSWHILVHKLDRYEELELSSIQFLWSLSNFNNATRCRIDISSKRVISSVVWENTSPLPSGYSDYTSLGFLLLIRSYENIYLQTRGSG